MNAYPYDLHIHSCLSPCADDDMTPANIAGMAYLNGIRLMALTDHNTCGNCAAFMQACRQYGIVAVPGMELETSEAVHLVCLFDELETALKFDAEVRTHYAPLDNRPEIFGNQLLVNAEDEVVGEETRMLLASTDLDLDSAAELVRKYGGAVYPAHIDRTSNGIIAILGAVPPEPGFTTVEVRDRENREKYVKDYGLEDKLVVVSSDAHNLWSIREDPESLELDDEPYSSAKVRKSLIKLLRGE